MNLYHNYGNVNSTMKNIGIFSAPRPLSRKGSFSCHICSDSGPRFLRSQGPPPVQPLFPIINGYSGPILTQVPMVLLNKLISIMVIKIVIRRHFGFDKVFTSHTIWIKGTDVIYQTILFQQFYLIQFCIKIRDLWELVLFYRKNMKGRGLRMNYMESLVTEQKYCIISSPTQRKADCPIHNILEIQVHVYEQ